LDVRAQTELDLIGAIYDAVIDASRWDDTVDRIRRHLGFQLCMLTALALPSGKVIVGAQSNVPSPYSEMVYQYGAEALDQWGGLKRIETLVCEEPVAFSDHNELADLAGNPFYENWSKPQGLVDQLVLILEYNTTMLANIAFGVHESSPPISEAQIEGLRVLAPHLRRAAIISGLLDGHAQAAASFEAALTALGSGVVLVDEDMRIVYANKRAEAMLAAGDPVTRVAGCLDLPRELVRGQLRSAIAAAATDAAGLLRGSGIPARRRDGGEMVVHVLPLRRRQPEPGIPAVAAVFIAETSVALNLPLEALQLLYGLRPAETRVFELIVQGYSSARIATSLGVAPNTVKTHTQRLFDKVGVHSRVHLARLARDLSLGVR
jgi:DNA-binding CsgD family transcriptional regulator